LLSYSIVISLVTNSTTTSSYHGLLMLVREKEREREGSLFGDISWFWVWWLLDFKRWKVDFREYELILGLKVVWNVKLVDWQLVFLMVKAIWICFKTLIEWEFLEPNYSFILFYFYGKFYMDSSSIYIKTNMSISYFKINLSQEIIK
jgi:hypothetical protein